MTLNLPSLSYACPLFFYFPYVSFEDYFVKVVLSLQGRQAYMTTVVQRLAL